MKKTVALILVIISVFAFTSCEDASSYSALMLVRSTGGEKCSAKFQNLDGRLVLNAKNKNGEGASLCYSAELGGGSLEVYYKIGKDGEKQLLFALAAGESIEVSSAPDAESSSLTVGSGDRIYIYLEADSAEDGNLKVWFEG